MAIAEQRRVYDWMDKGYDQIRVKTLAFLGGGLAALTFLYSNGDTFYPTVTYGKIFYLAGLGLTVVSLGIILAALKPKRWEFPTDKANLKKLNYNTEKQYLEYVRDRYLYCYKHNLKTYEAKQGMLDIAFLPLVFGVTILVVLKLFGG